MTKNEFIDQLHNNHLTMADFAKILGVHPTTVQQNLDNWQAKEGCIRPIYELALKGIENSPYRHLPVLMISGNVSVKGTAKSHQEVTALLIKKGLNPQLYHYHYCWVLESKSERILRNRRKV